MTMKRKRRVFQSSEPAYRAFLTKFDENRSFNDECINLALDHAFTTIFKSQISSDAARGHLVQLIFDNKEKILSDLEILRVSPDSKIELLKSKKIKSDSDSDDITKKRKLDSPSQEETTVMSDSNNERSSENCSNEVESLLTNIERNEKENQSPGITIFVNENLEITIENDKNLQEMSKSCNNINENNNENWNKSFDTEQNHLHEDSREINHEENKAVISQVIVNNIALQEVDNQTNIPSTPLLSVNSQENVSSLSIANYTNFIPSVQSFNNCSQMPHMNYLSVPFMHHPRLMNNQYGYYPTNRMYYFPVINPFFSHFNHAMQPVLQNRLQMPPTNQNVENGNTTTNHWSSNQNQLQQMQANQITENRSISHPLLFPNSLQSMPAYQIMGSNPVNLMHTLHPVQQLQINQSTGNNSSYQSLNTLQEMAKLPTIFNLNSQIDSLQNSGNHY